MLCSASIQRREKMFAVIFGRPGCPYCVRAKQIAELV